jgi:hypothetical protein
VPGVYVTANPTVPTLLARYCNRVEDYATNLTGDGDILCRRRIPFDFDATRPAGISSTDEECARALAAADRTVAFLVDHGVPRDSLLDVASGNGAHVHLAVELPNTEAATTLVRTILAVVATAVDDEHVHVDQTMFNASRIIKVPGTLARKGDSTPERPHRLATFRTIPTRWMPVDTAVLHALPALHQVDARPEPDTRSTGTRSAFDVRDFLTTHGVTITREKPWTGTKGGRGTFLELDACVFDPSHDRGEAGVILLDGGMLLYACRHNSCRTKRWDDVRRQLDPTQAHARQRTYERTSSPEWEPGFDADDPRLSSDPWDRAISAAAFLAEVDPVLDWLEPRLLSPGAITQWYSPRGLGKTQIALGIAIRLARAGHRVLLLDRDNPQREVKRRLRAWGAEGLATLDVMTRDDVPHLLDRTAWAKFPRGRYALVIIDSWDAASEGVGEQDSAKPSQATATLNDLAHVAGGPAVLVLGNTVKSGSHGRGSGVVEDRADLVYEVRDATALQPSGTRAWWAELPPAGRDAWVDRAGRRKHRERGRLAFVPSKFRLGEEPDPFALELDFTTTPWSMRDVTAELVAAGEAATEEAKEQAAAIRVAAVAALRAEIEARESPEDPPYTKERAVAFLTYRKIKRDRARLVLDEEDGRSWRFHLGGKRGNALLVVPVGTLDSAPRETAATPEGADPPSESLDGQTAGDIADTPRETPSPEVPTAHSAAEEGFSRTALGADREKPLLANACATRVSEEAVSRGGSPRKTPPRETPDAGRPRDLAQDPEIPPAAGSTVEDVLAVFPGAQVVVADQPVVWPPDEIVQATADALVLLARTKGTPCVPLAEGLTILGTDWAWQAFAATASPAARVAARTYLERLPAPTDGHHG